MWMVSFLAYFHTTVIDSDAVNWDCLLQSWLLSEPVQVSKISVPSLCLVAFTVTAKITFSVNFRCHMEHSIVFQCTLSPVLRYKDRPCSKFNVVIFLRGFPPPFTDGLLIAVCWLVQTIPPVIPLFWFYKMTESFSLVKWSSWVLFVRTSVRMQISTRKKTDCYKMPLIKTIWAQFQVIQEVGWSEVQICQHAYKTGNPTGIYHHRCKSNGTASLVRVLKKAISNFD